MKRMLLAAVMIGSILPGIRAARADGCFPPPERNWQQRRERAYINEPEQKAVIYFHQGTEDLIISPSFSGDSSEFAWVVPVPARPKVRTLEGALFHELARLAFPTPPAMAAPSTEKMSAGAASRSVTVLERKDVGDYDVSVLEANDGQALIRWLHTNGYHLPEKAVAPVEWYVHEQWTFIACRIKNGSTGSGLQTGTLAPIRLTFDTRNPMYPMRLSSANPSSFHVLAYILIPKDEAPESVRTLRTIHAPDDPGLGDGAQSVAQVDGGQTEYPTLASLTHEPLRVFVEDAKYISPARCTDDFTWSIGGARDPIRNLDERNGKDSTPHPSDGNDSQTSDSTGSNSPPSTVPTTSSSTGGDQSQGTESSGLSPQTVLLILVVGSVLAGLLLAAFRRPLQ